MIESRWLGAASFSMGNGCRARVRADRAMLGVLSGAEDEVDASESDSAGGRNAEHAVHNVLRLRDPLRYLEVLRGAPASSRSSPATAAADFVELLETKQDPE